MEKLKGRYSALKKLDSKRHESKIVNYKVVE